MWIKPIIYAIVLPFVIYALDALNFEKLLKKNKVMQARILYFIFSIVLTYFIVSFIYDFF